ncbi:NAD(P)H-hydrate dehydratase [Breoghania sp.]|uniref:NAD(P)H-hydrate dehydratase n=1 Tax=Breoghania sp. TaxID=2065378 RepID=UPI002618D61C|nr:NAD(P)H-hydrate dehydratase [Breoghania sp.]MDJ0932337.1 NAD(P)H-hydrate dehydratase [Breoghania sp.]
MQHVLSVAQMGEADRRTIAGGCSGLKLMEAAGLGVADVIAARQPLGKRVLVLAGPGNNGGDGFAAARILRRRGYPVTVALLGDPDRLKGDAKLAFEEMGGEVEVVRPELVENADVVIDALFGAGLDRPLKGKAAELVRAVNSRVAERRRAKVGAGLEIPGSGLLGVTGRCGFFVAAVDLPSGVSGDSGAVMGVAIEADVTITFCRRKPGHLLFPGRGLCGPVHVVDIGIPDSIVREIGPRTYVNEPALWCAAWHAPSVEGHKYARGHVLVAGGPVHATGASRMAAGAALRMGAGLVTVASPKDALTVNAAHLTAVMIRPVDEAKDFAEVLSDRRFNSVLVGPGFGVGEKAQAFVHAVLDTPQTDTEMAGRVAVLDADALTSFADRPETLFEMIAASGCRDVVLTPHDGEFARLFPDLAKGTSRLEQARAAARRSGATVLLKGADTVIAAPDGRAAINVNAPAWLATAGAGDVLAGIIAGLAVQGLSGFDAAVMGAWCHGEVGQVAGAGLIAEDLAPCLKPVIERLAADCDSALEDN